MLYHIFTDASADLDPAFAAREDIRVIPMVYTVGDMTRTYAGVAKDGELEEYYDGQRKFLPSGTTQINPQNYVDAFRPYCEKGEAILYLSLSGGLSSTYQSSLMGVQELLEEFPDAKIRCVDSRSATIGIGVLAEAAAANRAAGMSLDENGDWLEDNRLRLRHWFMVEDLGFLKRGGRISPATAVVGAALNIKPILRILPDGTLQSFAKKRGPRAAMDQLVSFYRETGIHEPGERVSVVHADNPEAARYLTEQVLAVNPQAVVTQTLLTPIIGCHVGPGMCAIVNWSSGERD